MNDIESVLFFLQTLHYREDLENKLFQKLISAKDEDLPDSFVKEFYGQKVHPELIKNTEVVLKKFGVLKKENNKIHIDQSRLSLFMDMVKLAKASREYKWPTAQSQPYIYISPPHLVTNELAGDVDDITNLIIGLVTSAKISISLMSPFTNNEGLRAILAPLVNVKYPIAINIYFSSAEDERVMIYSQIKQLVPNHLQKNLTVHFCVTNDQAYESLPHAKTIVVDSEQGYLGSANFTKQGLNTRFELGVKLDQQQCQVIDKMLKILIHKGIYTEYSSL